MTIKPPGANLTQFELSRAIDFVIISLPNFRKDRFKPWFYRLHGSYNATLAPGDRRRIALFNK